ncbi:kinetochore-associated Ndc80 complex subunit ndc80 [Rhizoclosmatium sp. JEL0117]|nr:kinetochore-associated Ndc80 complex subunit ndc80 [Rhizoclosmatium sp. JEL0117]
MSQLPRLSMAANSKASIGGLSEGLAGLQLNQRYSSIGGARGGLAGAPGGRRSSAYVGRPSNMGIAASINAPLAIAKDPRPIRDKQWQANAIRNLIAFLVQAGYNQPVSPKTLQAPSAKDFTSIFKFLYAQLDPRYVFVKKFEEEVPVILRGLRYPFCDQISKSHLASVGSMHAWPSLLAMLTWMVELIMCCDQMDTQNEFDDDPVMGAQAQGEKVFFDYLTKAYAVFLAGDDNYDAMDDELISNFDRKNEKTVKDVEKLKVEHDVLSKEWASLRDSESPLTLAERESATLASDIEKFKLYIANHLEPKKQKLEDQIKVVEEELACKETELDKQTIEKNELTQIVDSQEISPADVDRMTSEREQLVRALETLAKKADETNKVFWEKEMAVQKKMDQLEKLVQTFNTLSYDLGFLSSTSKDTQGVNFELELNFQTIDPTSMVSTPLTTVIKPTLLTIRASYNAAAHKAEDDAIATQETLDRLTEACAEKCDELMALEQRISKLNDAYNAEKEVFEKKMAARVKEMEVLESEMGKMRLDSSRALEESMRRLRDVGEEYDQLSQRFYSAKDEAEKGLLKVLEGVIGMKDTITAAIEELKAATEAEYQETIAVGASFSSC